MFKDIGFARRHAIRLVYIIWRGMVYFVPEGCFQGFNFLTKEQSETGFRIFILSLSQKENENQF